MLKVALLMAASIAAFMLIGLFDSMVDGEAISPLGAAIELAEAFIIFGAVAMTARSVVRLQELQGDQADLISKVENARFEGSQWRKLADDYVQGLGQAISRQFCEWNLTESESEIAMLVLKGFSNREIATFRNTSETTVRQQASAIYRKSGLRNHRELSAYFLEDLVPAKEIDPNPHSVDFSVPEQVSKSGPPKAVTA